MMMVYRYVVQRIYPMFQMVIYPSLCAVGRQATHACSLCHAGSLGETWDRDTIVAVKTLDPESLHFVRRRPFFIVGMGHDGAQNLSI